MKIRFTFVHYICHAKALGPPLASITPPPWPLRLQKTGLCAKNKTLEIEHSDTCVEGEAKSIFGVQNFQKYFNHLNNNYIQKFIATEVLKLI